jgi:hypothetical protein
MTGLKRILGRTHNVTYTLTMRILLLTTMLLCASFAQILFISLMGASEGTLGIRPLTSKCVGVLIRQSELNSLREGVWENDFLVRVRYDVRRGLSRPYCLGHDLYYE